MDPKLWKVIDISLGSNGLSLDAFRALADLKVKQCYAWLQHGPYMALVWSQKWPNPMKCPID